MVATQQGDDFAFRLRSFFNGRSTISRRGSASSAVSPKSPAPRLGVAILSSPTIRLPGLSTHTSPSSLPSTSPRAIGNQRLSASTTTFPASARLRQSPSTTPSQAPSSLPSPQNLSRGAEDRQPFRLGSADRQRRRRRTRNNGRPRSDKKNFFRKRAGRLKLFRCVGLGLVLVAGATTYLALALSGAINNLNVHILMSCIGLLLVIAFAYSAVRLWTYVSRPPEYPASSVSSRTVVAPQEPIPVVLRRDEEDVCEVEEGGTPKDPVVPAPPPVYGLWRGSTRMDPNLVHWRRNENRPMESIPQRENRSSQQASIANRPPSYATESEVAYLEEPQLRPIAEGGVQKLSLVHPAARESSSQIRG